MTIPENTITRPGTLLTIGELSRIAAVDAQTIRYYERVGVLPKAKRNRSGYRVYDPAAARRLSFIKRAKSVGFTLRETKTLLSMADGRINRCSKVQRFIDEKLARVRDQIANLTEIETSLSELKDQCESTGHLEDCPALNKLLSTEG